jgi:hypothetical protein
VQIKIILSRLFSCETCRENGESEKRERDGQRRQEREVKGYRMEG